MLVEEGEDTELDDVETDDVLVDVGTVVVVVVEEGLVAK